MQRLEDAARELSERAEACRRDIELMRDQRERLLDAAVDGQRLMDEGVRALEDLREEVLRADDETLVLKAATERQEQTIRDARRALDAVRALAAELDVSRATAEADLAHLAQQSLDAVQADLDDGGGGSRRDGAPGHHGARRRADPPRPWPSPTRTRPTTPPRARPRRRPCRRRGRPGRGAR